MYGNQFDKNTQLKDINEQIQELIVESLKNSEILYIRGDIINAYRSIKQVFYKIAPFDFKNKNYLVQCTTQIDDYLKTIENGGNKPDLSKIIKVNQQQIVLKELIEEYFQLIPHCLRELNLYLRVIKRNDDPDQLFSDETFTTNDSLLEHKKKELATVEDVVVFIKNMTPRQIHDVHARLLTYKGYRGMKRLEPGD